ncbi:MAG: ubiquitinyl hydrolase 1 [Trizodia sp. TS-e1964]|nr:MAG: ubiquitinyl hydrolase 1 [Trizodia sp. TS-e1964]
MADTTSSNPEQKPETPDVPSGRKAFVPLAKPRDAENNPEVMTSLVRNLGLSKTLAFHDVFSIDDADLLAFVPRPAHALLLVFPVSDTYEKHRAAEDSSRPEYSGAGPQEEVVWFKQTIKNACGLIGLLHGVTNGNAAALIEEPESALAEIRSSAIPLLPGPRADLVYNSQALESAHASAAAKGDSNAPEADSSVDLHYVCFVKSANGHLWELDGRRKGPLDRGELPKEADVLSEAALTKGVRGFLKREEEAGGGDLRFSLVVLAPSLE